MATAAANMPLAEKNGVAPAGQNGEAEEENMLPNMMGGRRHRSSHRRGHKSVRRHRGRRSHGRRNRQARKTRRN